MANKQSQPSIIRLGVLLLLFDVYLTWARIEKATAHPGAFHSPTPYVSGVGDITPSSSVYLTDTAPSPSSGASNAQSAANFFESQSIFTQYLFFLLLCSLETLAFHIPIRLLSCTPLPAFLRRTHTTPTPASKNTNTNNNDSTVTTPISPQGGKPQLASQPPSSFLLGMPPYKYPNRISTALLVSSCTKLFPILMVIWEYDLPSSASAVSWAVIVNNIAALEILLECGYVRAAVVAAVGAACKSLVSGWLLDAGGLGEVVAGQGGGWWGFAVR